MQRAAEVQNDLLHVRHGTDENLWVEFYWNKVFEKHYVHIVAPGDNKSEWDRPVKDEDKVRFRKQWEAYQDRRSQYGDDVLVEELEFLNEAQVKNLKALNIHTVTHLANVADSVIGNIGPGGRELVKMAGNWIEEQGYKRESHKMREKLMHMEAENGALRKEIDELKKEVSNMVHAMGRDGLSEAGKTKTSQLQSNIEETI